jgi:acyl-CoA dehydrogenase
MSDRAPVFEEAGYSLFGPIALSICAPDEGNVHLLAHVASYDQKERFLGPLASGELRSAFAMTEPSPGAGSDPAALRTTATRSPTGWMKRPGNPGGS